MKYRAFVDWCNERACDGRWGMNLVMMCIDIMDKVRPLPFWKREKRWQELNKEFNIEGVIKEVEAKY